MSLKSSSRNLMIIETVLEDKNVLVVQHFTQEGVLLMQSRQEKAVQPETAPAPAAPPVLKVADGGKKPEGAAAPAPAVSEVKPVPKPKNK